MGNLLSYSGLSTKIRAMQSKLIKKQQFQEISQLTNVPQVVTYLKKTSGYKEKLALLDENEIHRGEIEKILKKSIFRDFSRIYHFANMEQRKFLTLYSKRYEIRVLKEMITNIFDHRDTPKVDISPYTEFFRHHSKLDLEKLSECTTMEEFINSLKGNEFYQPLSKIQSHTNPLVFDYGMALDLYYFSQIWEMRKKLFSGKDLEEITKSYGEKFDLLNLQFIYRSKKFFQMTPPDIYALLIPMNYKLKKQEITSLIEAPTIDEFSRILSSTYYGRRYSHLKLKTLEEFYTYLLRTVLEKESKKNPYSVAVIYSYLYHKEHEVNRLTIAIECIRYGIDPVTAMEYIRNN